jgi:hypothetical protein
MKVKELIALLQQCNQEETVTVWDAYHDEQSAEVHVSFGNVDKRVYIGTDVFGNEVKEPV